VFAPIAPNRRSGRPPLRYASLQVIVPCVAYEIGTGTGDGRRASRGEGIMQVVATDPWSRARWYCARENLERLGLAEQVEVVGRRTLSR